MQKCMHTYVSSQNIKHRIDMSSCRWGLEYAGRTLWEEMRPSSKRRKSCISLKIASSDEAPVLEPCWEWSTRSLPCPVGWGFTIYRLQLCKGVRSLPNECPGYNTKQSDGEVPVMLEFWGMQSNPSLPLLPGPLWPVLGAPDRALCMG